MIAALKEYGLLNPNLTNNDLKDFKKGDTIFERMFCELALLDKHIQSNTLHLVEFKLSKSTRKLYTEIKRSSKNQVLLVEADAVDPSKEIMDLINKFHSDNKSEFSSLGSDEKFKGIVPQNIGAQPGLLQKLSQSVKTLAPKAGQMAMNVFQAIVIGAIQKFYNYCKNLKQDLFDAKKQGTLWPMIQSKLLPTLKVAKKDPNTGQITYVNDTSGPGLVNFAKDFVRLNPKWANFTVGILVNLVKITTVGIAGFSGALTLGVIAGLVLRTTVGMLKGEPIGTAFKKAVVVTGISLLGGSITKGLFSWFKGGGFMTGAKEYFVGAPGADQVSDAAILNGNVKVSEVDVSKLMVSARRGGDTTLLTIIRKNAALYDSFKQAAEDSGIQGGDIRTYLRFTDNEEIADVINSAGGLPKNLLTTVATDTTAVFSGLNKITGEQLKTITTQSGGFMGLRDKLYSPEYYNKFLKPALEKAYPKSDPDRVLDFLTRSIAGRNASTESLNDFADIINDAGGLPPSITGNLADATAEIAGKSLTELGKLAMGGDAKAAEAYMQKFLVSGKAGETQYRILKTALDAGLIDKEKFFSGVGPQALRLGAQLRGNVPVSINGVSVIDYLTPEEASNAYDAMNMAQIMGNPVNADELAKLAAKAGVKSAQPVKESVYKKVIKDSYL